MKIRTGFVSNSSSSSFVIIGKNVSSYSSEKLKALMKNKKLYALGVCLGDGQDFFQMTPEIFSAYETMEHPEDLSLYEVCVKICESATLNKNDLPEGDFEVLSVEVDNHSTDSVESFEQNYER